MIRILYLFLVISSFSAFSQSKEVFVITDSAVANYWLTLGSDWRYCRGDNKEWANPDFDVSTWKKFSNTPNLNMPDGKDAIANRGEIVWFRKRLKGDNSLSKAVVINIYQLGASEIYLDGKLIHKIGKVNTDLNKVLYYNPIQQVLEFPVTKGKEQVLAIRYINAQYKFPLYANNNGFIRIALNSLENSQSADVSKNYYITFQQQIENNLHIALGIAILMFIIFLSFFLFFPNEKINGYFALSLFFLVLFDVGAIIIQNYTGQPFWIVFSYDSAIIFSFLFLLFCLYKIFEQPVDWTFKSIVFLAPISIVCFFLFDPDIVAPTFAMITFITTIKIAIQSRNKNRIGSILFIISSAISLLYWSWYVLKSLGLMEIDLYAFLPFAFMLIPISLSVYLGYAFGKRSQELRLNLERIQNLSQEKETILHLQNETLEKQVKERTSSLNQSLDNLKSTQSQLIQSEKMASLGELTAGIAHEIQNPLNFVNNFSEVSNELLDEIKEERAKNKENRDEELVSEILNDIKQNLEKINHHGKRADAIVKGMLQHSRSSSGTKEPTDINKLADEYLRLAYHGLRAKDKSFNATLVTNFDEKIGKIDIIPQEMGRVILNLITNAFYVVDEKKKQISEDYEPTVTVSTKKTGNTVEIAVKDNGNGIPKKVLDKIFQPFFTTKPTGQGTGLGLSLAYDIVKAHGGELKVNTEENVGTEFIISILINEKYEI